MHKAITVDAELCARAERDGVNLSRTMDNALRAVFKASDGLGPDESTLEEVVRAASEQRSAAVQTAIAESADAARNARESALSEIQPIWNLYVAQGPKPLEAKLTWIRSHRERHPALRTMTPEALLKELEPSERP